MYIKDRLAKQGGRIVVKNLDQWWALTWGRRVVEQPALDKYTLTISRSSEAFNLAEVGQYKENEHVWKTATT